MAAMEKGIKLPEHSSEQEWNVDRSDQAVLPILGIVLSTIAIGAMIVLYFTLPEPAQGFWIAPSPSWRAGYGVVSVATCAAVMRGQGLDWGTVAWLTLGPLAVAVTVPWLRRAAGANARRNAQ